MHVVQMPHALNLVVATMAYCGHAHYIYPHCGNPQCISLSSITVCISSIFLLNLQATRQSIPILKQILQLPSKTSLNWTFHPFRKLFLISDTLAME